MRFRSIILPFLFAFMLIAASSCNTRWDTTWAINFPESFQGNWVAENGYTVQITHNRFTISHTGSHDTISNESEYRYKFDWIEVGEATDTLVRIVPKNANGMDLGREDTFTINEDRTLSIEFGGTDPRPFGPFTKQAQTN